MKNKRLFNIGTRYSQKLLSVLEKFGMGPSLDLSGLDKDILDVISQIEDPGFYDLCECFDMKPSKMEKYLLDLEEQGLVEYLDAAGKVELTELAYRYLEAGGKDTKSQRKFRKFIECLTEEELDEFMKLADSFEIDESLLESEEEDGGAAEEDAETEVSAETFVIEDDSDDDDDDSAKGGASEEPGEESDEDTALDQTEAEAAVKDVPEAETPAEGKDAPADTAPADTASVDDPAAEEEMPAGIRIPDGADIADAE